MFHRIKRPNSKVHADLPSCVLSEGGIVIVDDTGLLVKDNVLQNRAEADSVENIRLLLGREANALGVAATLDVEHATVAPAVLVVTDKHPVGVGRQGGLARARQAKEKGDVAVLALVGRRVQSQDVVLDGHLVEQNGEDALLHLTGILGTEDDHLLLDKVDGDRGAGSHTLGVSVSREGTGIVDGVVGVEMFELFPSRPNKHVSHKESVVGTGADNPHPDAVLLIPTGISIDDINPRAGVQVVDSAFPVDFPDLQLVSQPSPIRVGLLAAMGTRLKVMGRERKKGLGYADCVWVRVVGLALGIGIGIVGCVYRSTPKAGGRGFARSPLHLELRGTCASA